MLKAQDDEAKPEEYDNLVLDELAIATLSAEDSKFLETFTSVEVLCMNETGIRSLENLPTMPLLKRFELQENKLSGDELKHLSKYASTLVVLKLASNKFTTLDQLNSLTGLKELKNLDLGANAVTEVADYKKKVWELLPNLEVLDGYNKKGEEILSDDSDDFDLYGDEEGENDMEGNFIDDELNDEELAAELKKRGISMEDFRSGKAGFDMYGEEGEDEFDEEAEEEGSEKKD